jgi:hypothetical protein
VSNGTYLLIARIYDNAGNMLEETKTIHVENDIDPPVISSIIINPEYPEYYEEATIMVGVVDASGIDSVTLHYIIGTGGVWDSMPMTADASLYSATIAPQAWDTEVFFYIVAEDIFGATLSEGSVTTPYSYVVEDTIKPTMNLDLPSTTETLKGEVIFGIELEDLGSGLASFQIMHNEEVLWDGITTEYILDTRTLANGEYVFNFEAIDQAGNSEFQTYSFNIHNRLPSTEGFINFIKNFGVLIGAIIGGAGIGTYYFIRWRKAKAA